MVKSGQNEKWWQVVKIKNGVANNGQNGTMSKCKVVKMKSGDKGSKWQVVEMKSHQNQNEKLLQVVNIRSVPNLKVQIEKR